MGNSGKCLICGKTVANISKHTHSTYSYSAPRADKKNFFPAKPLTKSKKGLSRGGEQIIYSSKAIAPGETSGVADETAEITAAVQDAVAVQDVAAGKL